MKITVKAAKDKAEIIQRREEYRAQYDADKAKYEEQMNSWRTANRAILEGVENEVRGLLGHLVQDLNIDVTAEFTWRDQMEVRVESNEHRVHSDDKALSWSWRASLDRDGQIMKESNSWSGLHAVTEAQIASLKMSVEALEILSKIDWATVLDKKAPDFDEYVTTREPRNRESEFKIELEEAEIENAMENNFLIKGQRNTGKYYRGEIYYCVVGETPAQYKVVECPAAYVERVLNGDDIGMNSNGWIVYDPASIETRFNKVSDLHQWLQHQSEYRISKDKFFENIVRPIEILE